MPFGLTNTSTAFQQFMNDILLDLLNVYVIVYLNDILIYLDNMFQHKDYVKKVLQWPQKQRNVSFALTL